MARSTLQATESAVKLAKAQRTRDLERFLAAFDPSHTIAIEAKLKKLHVPTLIVWGTDQFGYSHVGPASYLTRDGERVQNPDSAFIRADRLQGIAQYVAAHALEIDAVRLRELADHAPINYARAYF